MKFNKSIWGLIFLLSVQTHANEITMDWKNLNISDLIRIVAKVTDTNISIEEKIHAKIDFPSSQAVHEDDLIPLTQIILESQGMTLEDTKDGYKVIKIDRENETEIEKTMNTLLFQLKEENYAIVPLLDKCRSYEYLSNRDGIFYLVVTANKELLVSLERVLNKDENTSKIK